MELALVAADLLALAQTMLLTSEPELHLAGPMDAALPAAARRSPLTRGQRRVFLRLVEHWPWTLALVLQRLR